MEGEQSVGNRKPWKLNRYDDSKRSVKKPCVSLINSLDDGCLMHIFSFLSPIPDRHNTALVCHRWRYLACHPRMWLRVDASIKDLSEPGVYPNIEAALAAARPGDTILIAAGDYHQVSNIQINKPLCLIGGGELPDETTLVCSRGSESALEFLSTCKLANLTVKAELGCCLLHRSGRLTIDGCILQCESNPLDFLSCAIISTAGSSCKMFPSPVKTEDDDDDRLSVLQTKIEGCSSPLKSNGDSVSVMQTRIEGGSKAVVTRGNLVLQRVRVIYARTNLYFWFDVGHQ